MRILVWIGCLAVGCLLLGCDQQTDNSGASAGDQSAGSGAARDADATTAPDNTGRNERDRSDQTLTPGDQGSSEADREITRKIRRAINENDQLSTDAKNIKIVTVNGKVTLRGPVASAEELSAVQAIVQKSGVTSFDNQMEIKATNQ